jgi:DNA-3-methyladenine glycosylase
MIITADFYLTNDVTTIARNLLGKYLFTFIDGVLTGGYITEAEAYEGETDKASHAYGGRKTKRTYIMYQAGGVAYVYLCYGIHSLFNIVTNKEGIPHAVLIRGLMPAEGQKYMKLRGLRLSSGSPNIDGPGNVSKALGIHYTHTGLSLLQKNIGNQKPSIWLEDRGMKVIDNDTTVTARVGVAYAGEDAKLPYRYLIDKKKLRLSK